LGVGVLLEKVADGVEPSGPGDFCQDASGLKALLLAAVAAVALAATAGAGPVAQAVYFIYDFTVTVFQAAWTEVQGALGRAALCLDLNRLLAALVAGGPIFAVVDAAALLSHSRVTVTLLLLGGGRGADCSRKGKRREVGGMMPVGRYKGACCRCQ